MYMRPIKHLYLHILPSPLSTVTVSPPVGAVLDGLRVDLAAAHVFDAQQQLLPVSDLGLPHGLQVGLLHLGVASPYDLSTGVHGHGWFLPPQLRQRGKEDKNGEVR